ncbi:hypothetical protein C0992_006083 [Termitomyces sp. T32_za158]|nr:hypothetical protein C0992_006083 [Termitomyces sp. T32_za158]
MSTLSESAALGLAGLSLVLSPTEEWQQAPLHEIIDDIEGEQETLFAYEYSSGPYNKGRISQPADLNGEDSSDESEADADLKSSSKLRTSLILEKTILEASKGVTEGTDAEYKSQMRRCVDFLQREKLIEEGDSFFKEEPCSNAPSLIVAWIMNTCDEINLDGSKKPQDEVRGSYSHAQKMRAAMTYGFGRLEGLGSLPWHRSEVSGKMLGNPSVSNLVSSYMVSLRRRKVRSGETQTSARAITPEIMKKLYHYNHQEGVNTIKPYQGRVKRGTQYRDNWGGARTRRLLGAVYTIAFICMLRFDEVLKIQAKHIRVNREQRLMKLELPFRKTHQYGEIKPFFLHMFPEEEAHLCPVRAFAEYINTCSITEGYIFRKICKGDRISTDNTAMVRIMQKYI